MYIRGGWTVNSIISPLVIPTETINSIMKFVSCTLLAFIAFGANAMMIPRNVQNNPVAATSNMIGGTPPPAHNTLMHQHQQQQQQQNPMFNTLTQTAMNTGFPGNSINQFNPAMFANSQQGQGQTQTNSQANADPMASFLPMMAMGGMGDSMRRMMYMNMMMQQQPGQNRGAASMFPFLMDGSEMMQMMMMMGGLGGMGGNSGNSRTGNQGGAMGGMDPMMALMAMGGM